MMDAPEENAPPFTITFPPFVPADIDFPPLQNERGGFLVHVHFPQGFVYGMVAPARLLRAKGLAGRTAVEQWVRAFVIEHVLGRIERWGKTDLLLILGSRPLEIHLYAPLPETRKWRVDQGITFFYFPPIWVGDSPVAPDRTINFEDMKVEVYRRQLSASRIWFAVTRDGQVTVDFSEWTQGGIPDFEAAEAFDASRQIREEALSLWMSVANVFQTCLHATAIRLSNYIHAPTAVTPRRIHKRRGINCRGGGGPGGAHWGLEQARNPNTYNPQLPPGLMDWRIADRNACGAPLRLDTLDAALDVLDSLVAMPVEKGLRRVELYGFASRAFCDGNFSLALLQGWLVTESLLHEMWRKHPRFARSVHNIGEVTDKLHELGSLPDNVHQSCDRARRVRNKLVHELLSPDKDTTFNLLQATEDLFSLVLALEFRTPLHISSNSSAMPVD